MAKLELKVTKRDVLGKKVRFLRREGVTPVHLFGHGIESETLQCNTVELQKTMSQAGKTRLIELKIGKAKEPRSVMVREIQKDPLKGGLLHVDLYQVRMTEKMKVEVPVLLVGEAPALKLKEKMLERDVSSLNIECLPAEVPDRIEVDLSALIDSEHPIRVKDLKLPAGITILDDPEVTLARIVTRRIEEEVVVAKPAAEVTAEAAAEAGEGEAKKEKEEEKK
ncbi:MAG: 50S ribosomal protein L25 [Chloroflexi bacterium]|nr:50S ribosomal protein L25 [Chloroflexota bacterium]